MEGQLVQKTFTIDNTNLDCWVIKLDHRFWFKAHDIAVFLGYKKPHQAIRKNIPYEAQIQWDELDPPLREGALISPNWQPHTVLISEGGLYRLLCQSKKPEAANFEKWVFDDVLPTLRETGQYKLGKSFHEQLAIKDKELVMLQEKF